MAPTSSSPSALARGATLAAVPLVVLLFAAVEAGVGPVESYASKPWIFFAALAHIVAMVFQSLLGAVAYCVTVALLELWLARARAAARFQRPVMLVALHALPAAAVSAYAYGTLLRYEEFRSYPALVLPYVAVFGLLLALAVTLRFRPQRARLRYAAPALGTLAFVALHAVNHGLLPGRYFTLHLSLFQLELPLLFLSCAHALQGWASAPPTKVRRVSKLAAVCVSLLVVSLLAERTVLAATRSTVLAYTLLGESQVVHHPFEAGTEGAGAALADPNGVDRFLNASGMPQLPADFRLEDYNLLLVTSEALRFDRTSLADPALTTTPHLLKLESDGAFSFHHAHSPSSATLPSNASLMSMTYASAAHLETWSKSWCGELKSEQVTAAELLSAAGYSTFRISHNLHRVFVRSVLGLGQGFVEEELFQEKTKVPDLTVDQRIALRAKQAIEARRDKRFFGWVFFAAPHLPYYARYDDLPSKSDADRYLHELRYVDEQVGLLVQSLRDTGLLDKTILVFTADHGEELRDHRGTGHLTLFNECTHVPLLVRIPGVRGDKIKHVTSTGYVLPWLLLHASGELRAAARSRATRELGPMLKATGGAVITELVGHDKMQSALISDEAKLIYDFNTGATRVFDLRNDPGEKVNVLLQKPQAFPELRLAAQGYRSVRAAIRKYKVDPARRPGSREQTLED